MKKSIFFLFIIIVMWGAWFLIKSNEPEIQKINGSNGSQTETIADNQISVDPVVLSHVAEKADLILLKNPNINQEISSPLTVTGLARGYWFFEASFPVVLTNWDGLIIAEGVATAEGEWMTEAFVPFTANLEFVSPYTMDSPDFMQRGSLILQKDNPSGLPEHDDALEIPILFLPIE